jgi:hypothetical protein
MRILYVAKDSLLHGLRLISGYDGNDFLDHPTLAWSATLLSAVLRYIGSLLCSDNCAPDYGLVWDCAQCSSSLHWFVAILWHLCT